MTRAVLSIGSNIGDSVAHLQSVVDGLGSAVVAVSPVYSTAPWGGVEQQDFYNAVVVVDDPEADAAEWLRRSQALEEAADRVREQRWGPRSLDVDVVDCEGVVSSDPALTLPHPRAHLRAFVLVPWLDVDPDATLIVDGQKLSVAEILDGLDRSEREGVRTTDVVLAR
ncbi:MULTISPECIES: 2-amino-4-hydroxy-6-hydroxymethyldihydropteridine diphosphokinase [unclassified Rhodococcus (in: high G+C Gram-positive bacteria)]|uniref:2-amino-4-hydroxy-6-hydroxymethyldihydropteridine diphosphokinase n=1 Tax=Rhodococcus baikonurensis TaxID=172041 RepID=A0ABV5XS90_9NOCA|nr:MULTISPECIES: 2-amino-4-hydroxy-6-hydroxymethyldihydropteridine diphosphokinase [unclassified Rhodococcus (in: high G+C Gram-positive bacteria)]MDI9956823.1 2-amino-4-hydroxy-6-hydroxymethyldihydropteridine diphosphokinase [Rhodococcus sp. IEGM 1237]MDI9962637.1 2-amino-4-hydroxy-6-hydroxymethyldihydropteridine diphosphokinase [Rhodococcus sp. IEGM 1251]MDV8125825.1 2-amino-4-hydroxy-6-hydroxymethyldihydropteridine diphosphokinase [Rhodococcus sp. IEGM 1304]NHP17550.1 2-amino-4-hydroxy-6-hyd